MTHQSENSRTSGPTSGINTGRTGRFFSLGIGAALTVWGAIRRGRAGTSMVVSGAGLLFNAVTGHSPIYRLLGINRAIVRSGAAVSVPHEQGIRVEERITINRPVEQVFAFWRNFENLPEFMQHLKSVEVMEGGRSHWVAAAPAGMSVEWDAEVINEKENELIAWRSLEKADVDNAGSVQFRPAPGDQGTEVWVVMEYAPLAGRVGELIARLFGKAPSQQVGSDLRRLKQILEAGQAPTIDGESSGWKHEIETQQVERPAHQADMKAMLPAQKDSVEKASEDSFPASDPPAWTAGSQEM